MGNAIVFMYCAVHLITSFTFLYELNDTQNTMDKF